MSVQRLANTIKTELENRIAQESRALRGTIKNGRFFYGGRSYPYKLAVDANTSNGNRVWAQLSPNNLAVIIGE